MNLITSPRTLVWHKDALLINMDGAPESFWVRLSPIAGWVRFDLIPGTRGAYLPAEVRPAHESTPSPLVSLQGVLWLQQGACEVHQAIDLYQQTGDLIAQFSDQSNASRCLHEA